MLTSFREHEQLILGNASDFVQPDAPRVGGISPFLKIMDLAAKHGRKLAPHFAMEVHLHLSAAYPLEPWLEHFEWLNPLFNEQLELRDGRTCPTVMVWALPSANKPARPDPAQL